MKSFYELKNLVVLWARDRKILEEGHPYAQAEKTLEEAQELLDAIVINNKEEIIDALGDILVTIIIQAEMQNLDLLECLESAYSIINKRKGIMRNGQFIKETGTQSVTTYINFNNDNMSHT